MSLPVWDVLWFALVIEDSALFADVMCRWLRGVGARPDWVATRSAALEAAERTRFDVIFLDLGLGDASGFALIATLRHLQPQAAIVIVTGRRDTELAVDAVKAGADQYVTKPFRADVLARVTGTLLAAQRARREAIANAGVGLTFVTKSLVTERTLNEAMRAARHACAMLLCGETGTGKSELAAAIHAESPRAKGPLVRVNCAALTAARAAADLFGHTRGAFTGAVGESIGFVGAAEGGTLFLDEVAELPPEVQLILLTFTDHLRFMRVGDNKERQANVRLVCATNRPLEALVAAGLFREDLYHRINVITVTMPTLRARPEDIPALARMYLARVAIAERLGPRRFTPALEALLAAHTWAGNMRQLSHAVERAAILSDHELLDVDDVVLGPAAAFAPAPAETTTVVVNVVDEDPSLEAAERRYIQNMLERTGSAMETAKILGIARSTLQRKRAKYTT